MQKLKDLKKDGYNLYQWQLIEHSGTHLDAPIHFSENRHRRGADPRRDAGGAARGDQRGRQGGEGSRLPALTRRSRRLGAPARAAARQLLRRDEFRLGAARRRTRRNMSARMPNGVMHFPGVDPDAAAWLLKQRKVAGIAVDTLSLDHGASKDFKTHVSWLASGTLGPRECREPRQRSGSRRDAGRRAWRRSKARPADRRGCSHWCEGSSKKREAPARDRHRGFRRYRQLNSSRRLSTRRRSPGCGADRGGSRHRRYW